MEHLLFGIRSGVTPRYWNFSTFSNYKFPILGRYFDFVLHFVAGCDRVFSLFGMVISRLGSMDVYQKAVVYISVVVWSMFLC